MKRIHLLISFMMLIVIGISVYALSNTPIFHKQSVVDQIKINSYIVTDPGYECFAAPCYFRDVSFNLTIVNTVSRTIDYACFDIFNLVVLAGSNNYDTWFKPTEDALQITCSQRIDTVPVGVTQRNYTVQLYLAKVPDINFTIPSHLDIQIVLGNDLIKSPVFSLKISS